MVLLDGAIRWIMARGEVVHDDQGQPMALAGITLDITRRKQAEIALAQREAELVGKDQRRFMFEPSLRLCDAIGLLCITITCPLLSCNIALSALLLLHQQAQGRTHDLPRPAVVA